MTTALIRRAAAVVGTLVVGAAALGQGEKAQGEKPFRPPAVPLVTHDPYFSVWSFSDKLTDSWPRHWTGKTMGMCGMARIDGKTYRWCGPEPRDVPAMEQASVEVGPTLTTYAFLADGVELKARFWGATSTELPQAATPITNIVATVRAKDGHSHEVSLYLDCSAEWAIDVPQQEVRWSRGRAGELTLLSFASQDQRVLAKRGDDLRIDWGTFFLGAPSSCESAITGHDSARRAFARTGHAATSDDFRQPRAANDGWPVLAVARTLKGVEATPIDWPLLLGYDAQFSIELFGRKLRPLWASSGEAVPQIFTRASNEWSTPTVPCEAADAEIERAMAGHFGERFVHVAALVFRQTLAAHTIAADWDGTPLMFPKENFSNGCISTVDVIFPSSPFFLYFNPELLKAKLRPLMDYAASARWKWPFAPHDLGTYPLANGQVYGGGERTEEDQMPVEESGNMIIMLAALAQQDGNAEFAAKWWPTIEKWAAYLKEHGLDPENQLCTDDFAGHLAHNTNLAIKAIVALGGYAQLCERLGKKEAAAEYREVAKRYAAEWVKRADDGDHFRLAYDKPGTWSQKYNLVWDRVLGTGLFGPEVAAKEMAFYRGHINKYGLPLDGREKYAKLDFSVWTACLTGDRGDFEAIVNPLYDFANETPDRVPLTDWYGTVDAKCVGFRARSVVGAVYMPLLLEKVKGK